MHDNHFDPDQGGRRPPLSPEVYEHAFKTHLKDCGSTGWKDFRCPCGKSILVICEGCRQPIFIWSDLKGWCPCVVKVDQDYQAATGEPSILPS